MHWDEKIDKLRKETGPDEFKVPFTDWSTILKKIEDKQQKQLNDCAKDFSPNISNRS